MIHHRHIPPEVVVLVVALLAPIGATAFFAVKDHMMEAARTGLAPKLAQITQHMAAEDACKKQSEEVKCK